jgi:hypothetical protein
MSFPTVADVVHPIRSRVSPCGERVVEVWLAIGCTKLTIRLEDVSDGFAPEPSRAPEPPAAASKPMKMSRSCFARTSVAST